jgi:riboflavin synthase
MFTGIIEHVCKIKIESNTLIVENPFSNINIGDSIAINGVCLTISKKTDKYLTFKCGTETLRRTNLSIWNGREANLERALPVIGRFGGHIVTGHVDGKLTFLRKSTEGETVWMYFSMPKEKWAIAPKGSIAINGVSLTIAHTDLDTFCVQVIPYTFENTNFKSLRQGDVLNYEIDVLARYLRNIIQKGGNNYGSK